MGLYYYDDIKKDNDGKRLSRLFKEVVGQEQPYGLGHCAALLYAASWG